jgi:hypothetical protein
MWISCGCTEVWQADINISDHTTRNLKMSVHNLTSCMNQQGNFLQFSCNAFIQDNVNLH